MVAMEVARRVPMEVLTHPNSVRVTVQPQPIRQKPVIWILPGIIVTTSLKTHNCPPLLGTVVVI